MTSEQLHLVLEELAFSVEVLTTASSFSTFW